jgi:NTE family protein
VVVAEGDSSKEILVVQSGRAEVVVADRDGDEHRVGRIRPGATIGEVSLFTGRPASATVRAITDLDVLVLRETDFERVARAFPLVYRNVGAILSERLEKLDHDMVAEAPERVAVLLDSGAPPELSWAIACSVAWHARARTQLVVVDDRPPEALTRLVQGGAGGSGERAYLRLTSSLQTLRSYSLAGQVEDAFLHYPHVLVHVRDPDAAASVTGRVVHLAGARGAVGDGGTVVRAWSDNGGRIGVAADGSVHIPELEPADLDALRLGRLPPTTPAGKALGWVARDVVGLKVGLALGAGSLRGYAHVGVLKALEGIGLTPDYISGTSIGSAVAGMYAVGFDPDRCADILDVAGPALFKPTLSRSSLLSSRGMRSLLKELAGDTRIEDLPLPLGVVAADVATQREVIFRRGLLWLAVLASISIPGIYAPQRVGPYTLVDGGVLNPVPASAAASMGADVIIAVRLSLPSPAPAAEVEAVESHGRTPSALTVLLRGIEIMYSRISVDVPDATTIAITPELPEIAGGKLRNFKQGRQYIERGEAAMEQALPRMAAALPWLRSAPADGG